MKKNNLLIASVLMFASVQTPAFSDIPSLGDNSAYELKPEGTSGSIGTIKVYNYNAGTNQITSETKEAILKKTDYSASSGSDKKYYKTTTDSEDSHYKYLEETTDASEANYSFSYDEAQRTTSRVTSPEDGVEYTIIDRASSTASQGGAMSNGNILNELNANIINSGLTYRYQGGGLYNGSSANITTLTGVFINDYVASSVKYAFNGGAIYNAGKIVNLNADFIGNYTRNGANGSGGGAIANANSINNINGNFIGNYARGGNITGGAIKNTGEIQNITGDFLNNYVLSTYSAASGGAIYNNSTSTINSIKGDFIGNYAYSTSASYLQGGALYNYGNIESVEGNFINNYVLSDYNHSGNFKGGAIYNGASGNIDEIKADFIGNYAENTYGRTDTQGGAIYNEGTIGKIVNSSFYDNHSRGAGGAIYSTKDITIEADNGNSVFSGNYTGTESSPNSNAIYMNTADSTLTLNAKNKGIIRIDDGISGSSSGYNVAITGDNTSSEVKLNNSINRANVSLENVKLTLGTTNDEKTVSNVLADTNTSLTLNSGILNVQDDNYANYNINNFDGSANTAGTAIDILLDSANGNKTDTFTITTSAADSVINLSSLNIINNDGYTQGNTYTLQVLNSTDGNTQLSTTQYEMPVSAVMSSATKVIGAETTDTATTNDTILLTVRDAFTLWAGLDTTDDKTYTFEDTTTYTANEIGSLNGSKLTIQGAENILDLNNKGLLANIAETQDITFKNITVNNADDITNKGSLSLDTTTLNANVANEKSLSLTNSTLSGNLSNTTESSTASFDNSTLAGNITSNKNTISFNNSSSLTGDIQSNEGIVTFDNSSLTGNITNDLGGRVNLNSSTITGAFSNAGDIYLTGGSSSEYFANSGNISGSGTTYIGDGTNASYISNDKLINQAVTINAGSLLSTAGNDSDTPTKGITGIISNAGSLAVTSGAIANSIQGVTSGTSTVYGDLTTSDGVNINNYSVDVNNLTVNGTLNNAGTLTVKGSTIAGTTGANINNTNSVSLAGGTSSTALTTNDIAISGAGDVSIDGYINNNASISARDISVSNGKMLKIAANQLTDTNDASVSNAGTLELTGGTSSAYISGTNAVAGSGQTIISGYIDQNASIASTSTADDAIYITGGLKINADNLDAKTTNAGILELTGGQLDNAIAGSGSTSITGEVINASTISQTTGGIEITGSGKLTTSASGVTATITNEVSHGLVLNNGINTNKIQMAGTTGSTDINTTGTVTNQGSIEQDLNVIAGTFDNTTGSVTGLTTISAGAIGKQSGNGSLGAVTNEGSFELSNGSVESILNTSTASGVTQSGGRVTGDVENTAGTYTISAGQIDGAVTNTGTFNIKGGTIGTYTQSAGSTNVTDNATLTLGSGSSISGGSVVLGSTTPSATVGNIEISNGLTNTFAITTNGASSILIDKGSTYKTTTGNAIADTAALTIGGTSTNGILDVNAGSVSLDSNDTWRTTGNVEVTGGTLNLSGVTQSGSLNQTAGITNISGVQTLGTTANTVSITGGRININDDLTLKSGTINADVTTIAANKNLNIQGGSVTLDGVDGTATANVNWLGNVNLESGSLTLANIIDTTRDTGSGHNKEGILNATGGDLTIDSSNVLLGSSDVIADVVNLTLTNSNLQIGKEGAGSETTSSTYIDSNDNWTGTVTLADRGTLTLDGITTNSDKYLTATAGTLNLEDTATYGSGSGITFGNALDSIGYNVATTVNSDVTINAGTLKLDDETDTLTKGKITLGGGELNLKSTTTNGLTTTNNQLTANTGTLVVEGTSATTLNNTAGDTIAKGVSTEIDSNATLKINGTSANVTLNDITGAATDNDIWGGNIELNKGNLTLDTVTKATSTTSKYNQDGGKLALNNTSLTINSGSAITGGIIEIDPSELIFNNGIANAATVLMEIDDLSSLTITGANTTLDLLTGSNIEYGNITVGDETTASELTLSDNSNISSTANITIKANSKVNINGDDANLTINTDDSIAGTIEQSSGTITFIDDIVKDSATAAFKSTGGNVIIGLTTPTATAGTLNLNNSEDSIATETSITLNENGTIKQTAGSVIMDGTNDTWNGIIDQTGGTLYIYGNNNKSGYLTSNGGNLNIGGTTAGTLNINNNNDNITQSTIVSIAANGLLNQSTGNVVLDNATGSADSWLGAISLNGGTLELNGRTDTTSVTKTYQQTGGNLNLYDSSLTLATADSSITGGTVTLGSASPATNGTLILQNNSNNIAEVITQGANDVLTIGNGTNATSLQLTDNSAIKQAATVTINSGSTLEINSTTTEGVNLNGGATGADTWAGNVNVTGGVLNISDNLAKTGTLTQTAGSGITNITGQFALETEGDSVSSGTLNIGDGTTTTSLTVGIGNATTPAIKSGDGYATVKIASNSTMDIATGGYVVLDGGSDLSKVDWAGDVALNGGSLVLANIVDQSRDTGSGNNKQGKLTANTGNLTIDAQSVLLGSQDTIADAVQLQLNTENLYIGDSGAETTNVYIGTDDIWNGAINLKDSGTLTLDGITTVQGTNNINAESGNLNLINTGTSGHGSSTGITLGSSDDKILYQTATTLDSDLTINAGQVQLDDSDTITSGNITLGGGELDLNISNPTGITTSNNQLTANSGVLKLEDTTKLTLNNAAGDVIAKAVATTIDSGAALIINSDNASVTLNSDATDPVSADTWLGTLELNAGNLILEGRTDNLTGTTQTYNQTGGALTLLDSSLTIANTASSITGGSIALTAESETSTGSSFTLDDGTVGTITITSDSNENNSFTIGGTNTNTITLNTDSDINGNTSVKVSENSTLNYSGTSIKGSSAKTIENDGTINITNDGTTPGTIARAINNAAGDGSTGTVNLTGTTQSTVNGTINQQYVNIGDGTGAAGSNTSTFTTGANVTATTLLNIAQDGQIINAEKNIVAEQINVAAGASIAGNGTTEGNLTINNGGTNDGIISQSDITLAAGTLHNSDSITSTGTMQIETGAIIDNNSVEGSSSLTVSQGYNKGTITQGTVTVSEGNTSESNPNGFVNENTMNVETTLDNKGTLTNSKDLIVSNSSNDASIVNTGTITSTANSTITADTFDNENGTLNITKTIVKVIYQSDDMKGTINVLGSDASEDVSELIITGTHTDIAGVLNIGDLNDSTVKSTLNLNHNNITEEASLNIASGNVLNIDDSSIADTISVVIDGNNDTYLGDVNLTSGSVTMKDLTVTTGATSSTAGGNRPYYSQTDGLLTLENSSLTMQDASNISGGNVIIGNNSALHSLSNGFTVNDIINSGTLNAINNGYENYEINGTHYIGNGVDNNQANYAIDIYARSSTDNKHDTFGNDSTIISAANGSEGTIHISDFAIAGDLYGYGAPLDLSVNFGDVFKGSITDGHTINYTATDKEILTPIGYYRLAAKGNGNYTLDKTKWNPAVFRGQVSKIAQYQNQLAIGDMLFNHAMLDQGFKGNDYMSKANLYASANDLYAPYHYSRKDGGLWIKNYANFEKLNMNNGLGVGNNAYGTLIGADFRLKNLPRGWEYIPTAYIGYNGAHQYWNGNGAYQNGAQAGFMSTFYRGDLIIGALAFAGFYGNEMDTPRGNDSTINYFTGASIKTAYNWKLGKNLSLQPNLLVAYNYFGRESWHTDFGQMGMMAGMLHGANVAPGFNLIWEKETFSAYLTAQYMYNINQSIGGSAGNVVLPNVHMDRGYLQYGFGINKNFTDRFSGYFQTVLRNVGRTGIGFQLGFNWLLGKE